MCEPAVEKTNNSEIFALNVTQIASCV